MDRYKYFLIYDRHKKNIYGERIKWRCGNFDSLKEFDTPIRLKKKFKARFITSEQRIDLDSIDSKIKRIEIKDDILSFAYTEDCQYFITLDFNETLFNPLIDRCSKIRMFFGDEIAKDEYLTWVKEHKNLLEEIKTRFDLDFINQPELINSYTCYEPIHIIANCQFMDNPLRGENRLPTKLKVNLEDEFNNYGQAEYVITGYAQNEELQTKKGKVSESPIIIDFKQSPDKLKIEISDQGSIIYSRENGFLRNIQIGLKAIGNTVPLNNDSKVSIYDESIINIGKEQ